ncbi:MAG: hypothetical protein WC082_02280 [Victivallales bacterium]
MTGKIFISALLSLLVMAVSGCRQVIVAEVLQQPLGKKIYLKHNIWYENPSRISCLNIQKGKILPFGTEIEPIQATDYRLCFKTMDGKEFNINYETSLIMLPMENFIRQKFTLQTRDELTKGMKKEDVELLLQGKLKRGMTKEQVLLACGVPPTCRTPSPLNSTWVYWTEPDSVYRIVFRRGRINAFVDINEPKAKAKSKKSGKK